MYIEVSHFLPPPLLQEKPQGQGERGPHWRNSRSSQAVLSSSARLCPSLSPTSFGPLSRAPHAQAFVTACILIVHTPQVATPNIVPLSLSCHITPLQTNKQAQSVCSLFLRRQNTLYLFSVRRGDAREAAECADGPFRPWLSHRLLRATHCGHSAPQA